MPIVRPCLEIGCPKTTTAESGRCPDHAREHEARRLIAEPWQALYDLQAWKTARNKTRSRDGWRCRWTAEGRRCANTSDNGFISVHHTTKLRVLWEQCGKPKPGGAGWQQFVKTACDVDRLVTLCNRHHYIVDSASGNAMNGDMAKRNDLSGPRRQRRSSRKRKEKRASK